jgi:hypothetical protein
MAIDEIRHVQRPELIALHKSMALIQKKWKDYRQNCIHQFET